MQIWLNIYKILTNPLFNLKISKLLNIIQKNLNIKILILVNKHIHIQK